MGNRGGTRAVKRYAAPSEWPVLRKGYKWTVKPAPGPHAESDCLPLLLVLRDLLKLVQNAHELEAVIHEGKVAVNGRPATGPDQGVGVMDILSLPQNEMYYRILPSSHSYFAQPINWREENFRLLRLEDRTSVAGGKMQFNLSGGVNILLSDEEAASVKAATLDTLLTDEKGLKIKDHIQLAQDSYVLVVKGRNRGEHGKLAAVVPSFKRRDSLVRIKTNDGETIETVLNYVYAIGKSSPNIALPNKSEVIQTAKSG